MGDTTRLTIRGGVRLPLGERVVPIGVVNRQTSRYLRSDDAWVRPDPAGAAWPWFVIAGVLLGMWVAL